MSNEKLDENGSPDSKKLPVKRCSLCHWSKDRKTRQYCKVCNRPVCGEHSYKIFVCVQCDK